MDIKNILVHVDSNAASRSRIRLSLAIARRLDASISALHAVPEPGVPPYFKPSSIERIADIYAENAQEAAQLARVLFQEETATAGPIASWECVDGELEEVIVDRGRFADLIVLGQFDTENPPRISAFLLPAKVAFRAAVPVLVVPNSYLSNDAGSNIVVAWDGSREAGRAIRDAMPFLKTAARVTLLAVDPLRQDRLHGGVNLPALVDHFNRHGVRVEVVETSSGEQRASTALLQQAGELGADLLVMGAYGHSRVMEFLLGGTTQDILEQTTIPVLLSR